MQYKVEIVFKFLIKIICFVLAKPKKIYTIGKMDFDLEYDYEEALERQKIDNSDIELLRKSIADIDVIPKTLTNKQVLMRILLLNILYIMKWHLSFNFSTYIFNINLRICCCVNILSQKIVHQTFFLSFINIFKLLRMNN